MGTEALSLPLSLFKNLNDENILELDNGDGFTTPWMYWNHWVEYFKMATRVSVISMKKGEKGNLASCKCFGKAEQESWRVKWCFWYCYKDYSYLEDDLRKLEAILLIPIKLMTIMQECILQKQWKWQKIVVNMTGVGITSYLNPTQCLSQWPSLSVPVTPPLGLSQD